jgi:hypothetical protein
MGAMAPKVPKESEKGSSDAVSPSPLLSLFKEQLDSECADIAQRYSLTERGHWLIYWYFMRLHDFTESQVEEVFCDGGGDLGIDAIWIDDEQLVHFYQFKNPENPSKGIPAGEVDKVLAGLRLILCGQHGQVANPELKARIDEIRQQLPTGYRLHLVSSGGGIQLESKLKLDALASEIEGPSSTIFERDAMPLDRLQERFYQQSLPAVKEPIRFTVPQPYMLRSGVADCYLFHLVGAELADLYEKHGEGLLQRNIRVDQRDTPTNRSIESTCTGTESSNFLHFNNGVTFLCEIASWDSFQRTLTLEKAQVVNGGQTIRALHRAKEKGSLKADVLVPARAITASGNKDFADNVSVNQNNQNQVGTGFLRSNDQRVVQLDHALAARGWYLERRKGELSTATAAEKKAIETKIGRALDGRVIRLTDGAQAYTATFYGQPEIAKKNVKKIFLSVEDGGHFERIFSPNMTAERVIVAHELKEYVDGFAHQFSAMRRKMQKDDDVKAAYEPLLGEAVAAKHSDVIHQVMPQCSLFLCGTIFKDLVDQGIDPVTIPSVLKERGPDLIREHLLRIVDFAKINKDKADKSWPALLKSNTFFSHITTYISGFRRGAATNAAPRSVTARQIK